MYANITNKVHEMEISEDGYHMGARLAAVGPNVEHATKADFKRAQARWLEEISDDKRLESHRNRMAYLWNIKTKSEEKTTLPHQDTYLQAPTDFLYRFEQRRVNNSSVGERAFNACYDFFRYEKLDDQMINRLVRMGKIYGEFFRHPEVEEECEAFLSRTNPVMDNEPTLDYDFWLRGVRKIFSYGPNDDLQEYFYRQVGSYFDDDIMKKLNHNREYIKWDWSHEDLTEMGGILDKRIKYVESEIIMQDERDEVHFIQGALIMALTYFLFRYYAEDKE